METKPNWKQHVQLKSSAQRKSTMITRTDLVFLWIQAACRTCAAISSFFAKSTATSRQLYSASVVGFFWKYFTW